MALFSRRPKKTDVGTPPTNAPIDPIAANPEDAASSEVAAVEQAPPPEVSISVSTFRGVGASAPAAPVGSPAPATPGIGAGAAPAASGEAPAATKAAPMTTVALPNVTDLPAETVPGLRDNVLLRERLARLSAEPTTAELLDVTRQLLQNHVYLRVKGDAQALLSEGKGLPLAVATHGDHQYALVFSSGAALQAAVRADGDEQTSAMGQPVPLVLRHILDGPYAGIIIDIASGTARATLPRTVLERALSQADPELRVKSLLADVRTEQTPREVGEALAAAQSWVAVNQAAPGEDGEKRIGVAEARSPEGKRLIELYTHPLEVIAMGRNDQPMPFSAAHLGKALRENEEFAGVIIDAAGPWIQLTREDLAPVIALPEPAPAAEA